MALDNEMLVAISAAVSAAATAGGFLLTRKKPKKEPLPEIDVVKDPPSKKELAKRGFRSNYRIIGLSTQFDELTLCISDVYGKVSNLKVPYEDAEEFNKILETFVEEVAKSKGL